MNVPAGRDDAARAAVAPVVAVVGGGPAGMVAALRLAQQRPAATVVLLERLPRLGGKIVTERVDGFVLEGGPEALVAAKPAAGALVRELGLDAAMTPPRAETAGTAVRIGNQLRPLPEGMTGLLPRRFLPIARSPVVSLRGKLRMALEPVLPARRAESDETVAAFFSRRIGREGYERLVAPLVESIWSGDGKKLSLLAAFPQLRQAEREHGSLTRAALAANRAAGAAPAGPGLVAPRGGLGELAAMLEDRLRAVGVRIETGALVESVTPDDGGWRIDVDGGEPIRAAGVVLAIPAHAASRLVSGFDPVLAQPLAAIPHASTATVTLGFREADFDKPLRGHGFVSRRRPGVPATAGTWVSRKWAGRAPDGFTLVRLSLGNLDRAALDTAPDDELVALARAELRRVAGIAAEPVLARVFRWPDATPQATLGHLDRVAAIEARRRRHPGLALASAGLAGTGLADAFAAGERAAGQVGDALAGATGAARPAPKPHHAPFPTLSDVRQPNAPDGSWITPDRARAKAASGLDGGDVPAGSRQPTTAPGSAG